MVVKYETESIWQFLSEVKDPEIPLVNIVGMGIVRDVVINNDLVEVVITPTYSGCPAMKEIRDSIEEKLRECSIDKFEIKSILSPPWTTDWIDDDTKEKLRASGITPPHKVSEDELLVFSDKRKIACPYCGSEHTKKTSEFGSTLCKSLHFCNGCDQPFEYFKCL